MLMPALSLLFFFNDTATTEIYTLSLHDALPICCYRRCPVPNERATRLFAGKTSDKSTSATVCEWKDRKSTRLNSSHSQISYAVFCLKKKKSPRIGAT